MTIAELKTRASEIFSSITLFCPDWPAFAQTNTEKKFGELEEILNSILDRLKDEEQKKWLRLCMQEAQQARNCYEEGDTDNGKRIIQVAKGHFRNVVSKKSTSPRF